MWVQCLTVNTLKKKKDLEILSITDLYLTNRVKTLKKKDSSEPDVRLDRPRSRY